MVPFSDMAPARAGGFSGSAGGLPILTRAYVSSLITILPYSRRTIHRSDACLHRWFQQPGATLVIPTKAITCWVYPTGRCASCDRGPPIDTLSEGVCVWALHIAVGYWCGVLVRGSEMNFLSALSHSDQRRVRSVMIDVVLATDMTLHDTVLEQFRNEVRTGVR
eukprot:9503870-Pyramimonas_sp.AAC.1